MTSDQEENVLFDEDTLLTDIFFLRKDLLRLAEEKLAKQPYNKVLQGCVEFRKNKLNEILEEVKD